MSLAQTKWMQAETARYCQLLAERGQPEPNWLGKPRPRGITIVTDKVASVMRLPPVVFCAGKCHDPVHVNLFASDHVPPSSLDKTADIPATTVMRLIIAPCRKCEHCKLVKMLQWSDRNLIEILLAPKAWSVTWSFEDYCFRHCETEAHRLKVVRREAELALKLIREKYPHYGIRFMAVVEKGERHGRLHLHLIVVQTTIAAGILPTRVLGQRVLDPMVRANRAKIQEQAQRRRAGLSWRRILPVRENRLGMWRCGFAKVKPISDDPATRRKAAKYPAKYVAKSPVSRIRASLRWGRSHRFGDDGALVPVVAPQEAVHETAWTSFDQAVIHLRHAAKAEYTRWQRQQRPDWCVREEPSDSAVTCAVSLRVASFVRDAYGATGPPKEHGELASIVSDAFGEGLEELIDKHRHQKKLSDMSDDEFSEWMTNYAEQFARSG